MSCCTTSPPARANAWAARRSATGARCACSVRLAKSWMHKDEAMTRLEKIYKDEVMPALMQRFGYQNPMQVPRISKITLNMGVGEAAANKKVLENATADMAKIAGQKPVVTKARVSVASFKIRDGWPIGCKVTLRRAHMWEFLDRLINISLPRVRDFRGVSGRAFDGRGNYNMGVKEQIIFPEIDFDQIDAMQIGRASCRERAARRAGSVSVQKKRRLGRTDRE